MAVQNSTTDNIILKGNERIDDLERNGLKIIQDTKRFCFGMDAVLLTGFIGKLREGDKVLDTARLRRYGIKKCGHERSYG